MTTPTTWTETKLPIRLSPGERVGIVAGSGRLPINVAERLVAAGHAPFVVLIEGEAGSDPALLACEHETLPLESFAEFVPVMKRHGVTHIVLAGGIDRRPNWRAVRPSFALLRILPRAIAALAKGDDGLLRILVRGLESFGFKVVGAHEIIPDILAPKGAMTRATPTEADWRDLNAALEAALAIGRLDIGQGAISIGGRVIALEGIEGTDCLLARVADMRDHGRLAGKKRGVLVKCAKPQQEKRADLPTIGPATVEGAHAAGLAGIGIEAGNSLVLDFGRMVERADELGLFVVGLPAGKPE
jgi:UDP-2,3-diacylglucosamine hydrolase